MGVAVSVVVPWFPSDEHRQRVWAWLRAEYARHHPGWELVTGNGGTPWCKAAAVADGVTRVHGDTLIVADADCWVDNLDQAVATLAAGAPWVIPHRLVHRLSPTATERVLEGAVLASSAEEYGYDQRPYTGWAGGGVVVLRRDDYQRAPLDTRFLGWGSEDASWALTLDTILGRHTRLHGDLYHLWHPPQPRRDRRVGNTASEALWRRYRRAARNRQHMEALVDEGRS